MKDAIRCFSFVLALCFLRVPLALAQTADGAQTTDGTQTPANSAPAASSSTPTSAAGAGSTTGTNGKTGAASDTPNATETPAPATRLSAGVDVYSGVSNLEGQRRFSDGFWASGASLAYPSIAFLKLDRRDGSAAKLSLGTGDLYRGSSSTVKQPVEAWYQKPVGKLTLTAGKYWVPFALQEWQYEIKPGVQMQRALGASDYVASLNYDRLTHHPNFYFRTGRNFGSKTNIGLSLAAGNGISYGSIHNKAFGLDVSLQGRNFKLFSEFVAMQRRSSDRFTFFYNKLVYDKPDSLKPFVAYYNWKDKNDSFGSFHSIAYGTTYQIRPGLLIEGGGAKTGDKTIYWVQLHFLLEHKLYESQTPTIPILPGMPHRSP